jgi:hypothetical protein
MATGLGTAPAPATTDASVQKLRAQQIVGASASWFLWIAGLSLVNSVIGLAGGNLHFIVGLGITQIVDAIAHSIGTAGIVLDLIINGIVTGVFVFFWHFARKGQKWAFLVGMVLYAADGLLLVLFKDILSVAFHAYALYRMYGGLKALPVLRNMETEAQMAAGAPIVPR